MKVRIAIVLLLLLGIVWWWLSGESLDWDVVHDRPPGAVIVAFGDSLTRGYGAGQGEAYPDVLAELIGRKIINEGVDGDTTVTALNRVDRVLVHKPDVVIITLGGNDILRRIPYEQTVSNLEEIFERLQTGGAMVVYAAVDPPLGGKNWINAVRTLCRERGVLYVESILHGLWSDTEMMSDTIHPNAKGYRVVAERIQARLGPHLR